MQSQSYMMRSCSPPPLPPSLPPPPLPPPSLCRYVALKGPKFAYYESKEVHTLYTKSVLCCWGGGGGGGEDYTSEITISLACVGGTLYKSVVLPVVMESSD